MTRNKLTSTQGVEMTVTSPENDPFKDFSYLDDQISRLNVPTGSDNLL